MFTKAVYKRDKQDVKRFFARPHYKKSIGENGENDDDAHKKSFNLFSDDLKPTDYDDVQYYKRSDEQNLPFTIFADSEPIDYSQVQYYKRGWQGHKNRVTAGQLWKDLANWLTQGVSMGSQNLKNRTWNDLQKFEQVQ